MGDPFEPRPDHAFTIGAGRQGGHHVDVSLRLTGAFDPDRVDVELALWTDDWRVARVEELDWFLHIDEAAPACDYLRARLVLVDEEGGLLSPARFGEITAAPLRLDARVASAGAVAAETFTVRLHPPD